jgi:hypothetical protein
VVEESFFQMGVSQLRLFHARLVKFGTSEIHVPLPYQLPCAFVLVPPSVQVNPLEKEVIEVSTFQKNMFIPVLVSPLVPLGHISLNGAAFKHVVLLLTETTLRIILILVWFGHFILPFINTYCFVSFLTS